MRFSSDCSTRARSATLVAVASLVVVVSGPSVSRAACNLIPQTTKSFQGTLGVADRPYGIPGEWISLHLDPVCHAASSGFTSNAADHVVTLVFTPPAGPTDVVVLSSDCAGIEPQRAACEANTNVSTAACIQVNTVSPPVGLNVIDKGGTRYLRVRFPDTDALVGATSDDRTLTGPVTVAVTTTVVPLPCSLASSTCAETSGLLACIDELFESDGSCAAVAHGVFPHFTALPPPNDYQSVCTTPSSPCTGTATEVRMTVDTDGNLLIPVDWRGILVRKAEVPVPRLLRAASSVDAFSGITAPIRIPNGAFVDSYTPEGGLLPPIFDPQTDPSATNELVLFGSADAPETVLRLARRSPNFRECSGGVRDALPCVQDSDCESGSCVATTCNGGVNRHLACTADADCPGGECGRGLFELRDRLSDGGVGPILVPHEASVAPSAPVRRGVCDGGSGVGQVCPPANCGTSLCVDYRIEAEFPVPLDGISTTDELHSFVVDEAIEAVDLNGDGDTSDRVVTVVDRDTGETLPTGLAATRLRTPPFGFPALAVEGAVVAFLEPDEVALGCTSPPACDANGDGDVRDTFLRVFRQEAGGLTELLASGQLAAEAVPEIDGKAVAVSQGLVFARMSEADAARQKTERVSVGSNGTEGNKGSDAARLSADGRFVAFQSDATNLVLGDTNAAPDVFVRDRQLGTTERVSVDSTGAQGVGTAGISGSYAPSISADGRFVAFWSDATNLVPGDTNGAADVFVHDRLTGTTERVSVGPGGIQANDRSLSADISADGRFVAFQSEATNLVAGDTNGAADVFVHDRLTGTTERVSTDSGGLEANASSGLPSISSDGRFVAFLSFATNVVAGDTNAVLDAFVHDRLTGTSERVSIDSGGLEANGSTGDLSISGDGRFAAFQSNATNLVAGDTNAVTDVFVHDCQLGMTERVSVDSGGVQENSWSFSSAHISISGDGRFVVFASHASNLVTGDTNSAIDVFVRDRLTGTTERVSLSSDGVETNAWMTSASSSIYPDGRFVAFRSDATNLVPGASNAWADVYVRGLDVADTLVDITGDGDVTDTLVMVVDAVTGAPTATPVLLCPAGRVSVAGGQAAFLRPEAAGPTPSLSACPTAALVGGDPDLSGDGDADDDVVHFWSQSEGSPVSLGLAASDLAMSPSWIAALISECDQAGPSSTDCAAGGTDLNGDGDAGDLVLEVHQVCSPITSCSWTKPTNAGFGQAADTLDAAGSVVAMITPEVDQGFTNLNGGGSPSDTDSDDRVLQVYDASTQVLVNVGQAVEEFVLGDEAPGCVGLGTLQLVAFRTSEQAQGGQDLNGDGDAIDDVLQVYDAKSDTLLNTGQAVTPCALEACDPSKPYRVSGRRVKFLTSEFDQAADLDGDGTATGLVLQSFDFCTATTVALASVSAVAGSAVDPLAGSSGGQTSSGATEGEALLTDAGRCFEAVATGCATNGDCAGTAFCDAGTCKREQGVCVTNADCVPDSLCEADLVVAVDTDADLDGVPDAVDNCPNVANGSQNETVVGGTGDACVAAICGDNVSESIEDCDGTDDAACPGSCLSDCTCLCGNVPNDPKAKVIVKARKDSGALVSKLAIQLGSYAGEAVSLRLDDVNSTPITLESIASLPARGKSGKKWHYKQRDDGIRKILLKDRTKRNPGEFLIVVKSKHWFTAAGADQAAPLTNFSVTIGPQCFRHVATKKLD